MLLRRLALAGDFADTDWTNPANPPPDNARRFRATSTIVVFELVGKASTLDTAVEADVGSMTLDAWVGTEGELRDPSDPSSGRTIRRGHSVVEATNATLSSRIRLVATDVVRGSICRLNLALINVGALAAVDVRLVSGGVRQ